MSYRFTVILMILARIALFVWWLADKSRFTLAFAGLGMSGLSMPTWMWALAGGIFLPWMTLTYLFVFPGGIVGFEWILLWVALLLDLAVHGGIYLHRHRLPGYQGK